MKQPIVIPPLNLSQKSPATIVQESSQEYSARSERHFQHEPNIKALEKNGLFVTLPEQKHVLVLRLDNRSMEQEMVGHSHLNQHKEIKKAYSYPFSPLEVNIYLSPLCFKIRMV